jgi:hypothetical protein
MGYKIQICLVRKRKFSEVALLVSKIFKLLLYNKKLLILEDLSQLPITNKSHQLLLIKHLT